MSTPSVTDHEEHTGRTCRGDGSAAVLGSTGDRDREIADREIDVFDDHGFPVPDGVLTGVAGADGDEDLVETGPFVIEIEDDGVGAGASLDQSWGVDLDATVPNCDGVIDHKDSFRCILYGYKKNPQPDQYGQPY